MRADVRSYIVEVNLSVPSDAAYHQNVNIVWSSNIVCQTKDEDFNQYIRLSVIVVNHSTYSMKAFSLKHHPNNFYGF